MQKTEYKFRIGELVKWYELYGDVGIVKDSGLGVVIKSYESHGMKFYSIYNNTNFIVSEDCLEVIK